MHLPFPGTPFACWSQPQGADDGKDNLHAPRLAVFFLFFIVLIIKLFRDSGALTMPKCSMNCGFEDPPLNTNHISPECKRTIHAVCVGRHLEDAPLGRDIICFHCIEDEELANESEGNGTTPVTTATIGGVTYKLTSL